MWLQTSFGVVEILVGKSSGFGQGHGANPHLHQADAGRGAA